MFVVFGAMLLMAGCANQKGRTGSASEISYGSDISNGIHSDNADEDISTNRIYHLERSGPPFDLNQPRLM